MKKIFILLIVATLLTTSVILISCHDKEIFNETQIDVQKREPTYIKVMSFNIRLKTLIDIQNKSWSKRKDYAIEIVTKNNPDVVCFQEVKSSQAQDLMERLTEYNFFYHDRGDGEGLAIAYKKEYQALDKGVFWLSETPDKKSRGFGASFYRICVFAVLKNMATDEVIVVTNVHLDHIVEKARINGVKLVVERMAKYDGALVICGDFNCSVGSSGYNTANEILQDSQAVAIETEKGSTFHHWRTRSNDNKAIDFIFVDNKYVVNKFEIINEHKTLNGKDLYYSDHYAILSTIYKQK